MTSPTDTIFWTLEEIQPLLFKLHTGPDASFKSLSCVRCADLAYSPSECLGCRRLTCKPCVDKNPSDLPCNWCGKQLSDDVHFLAQIILQNATYKCPYGCPEKKLKLHDMEKHIQEECTKAFADCIHGCGAKLHIKDREQHRELCTHEPVVCDKCE